MPRLRRIVPLLAVLALTAVSAPRLAHGQQPPPDNGGGPGGGGGGPGDMGGGGPPGGMGGPPSPAQQAQRMIRDIQRHMNVDDATFDAMRPDIQTIILLKQALDSNGRPERGGPPGGGGGNNGGGPGGPPDFGGGGGGGGGGGPGGGGGDQQNGGGGGGGGNDQNANAAADQGGNGGDTTTRRRRRRANQDANNGDPQQNDNGGNGGGDAAAQVKQDPIATELTEKVRALRNTLRQSEDGDAANGDADLATGVAALRSARTRAVDELALTRKDLITKVKAARQEAVLIAAGILE